jgi:putative ABC transport system substrate-binding protein
VIKVKRFWIADLIGEWKAMETRLQVGSCSGNPKTKVQDRKWVRICAIVLTFLGGVVAEAQPTKRVFRIGYLRFIEVPALDEAFRKGLKDLGYNDGQNLHVEYRYAGGSMERLAEFAAELVHLKVDVIVAGSTQSIDAARQATKTIPIVFPVTFDPVGSGFAASLARPGGNLTGLSTVNPDAAAKRVELLKEVMPKLSRLAVLRNPTNTGSRFALKETQEGARQLGMRLQLLEAQRPDDLEGIFRAAVREQAGALIVIVDAMFFAQRKQIGDLAINHRLPTMLDSRQYVDAGGLMAYGVNLSDLFRRAAVYVDKILKGAKPAELPIEQPTKFELVINLKTAKLIGVTIPQWVLVKADKVIR